MKSGLPALALFLCGLAMPAAAVAAQATSPASEKPASESCTGPASETRLYVEVSNIRSAKGLIAVTLYADDPDKFLVKHGSLYVGRVPATQPTTLACIHVPHPGTYGIAIYHDENANQKFDRRGIGLPAEGYGFSNNAPTFFGLPSFKSVRFSVARTDERIAIKLKYP